MNKLLKGSIAGAAGIALLLGGAGTLASWNSTANAGSSATITAGQLTIAPKTGVTTDGWKQGTTAIANIANYRIVPGQTITYTKTFDVTAVGDNLTAGVTLAPNSIAAASTAPADVALASRLTKTATFTVNGATATVISASAGTQTVVVTVAITFPSGTVAQDNPTMNGVVNLNDFAITLTQNV